MFSAPFFVREPFELLGDVEDVPEERKALRTRRKILTFAPNSEEREQGDGGSKQKRRQVEEGGHGEEVCGDGAASLHTLRGIYPPA